jgi:hypothetical protein
MKKFIKRLFLLGTVILISSSLNYISAQPSGPPTGGSNGGHDLGGNRGGEGGGASADGGLVAALALVAAFGAWKWYIGTQNKQTNELHQE